MNSTTTKKRNVDFAAYALPIARTQGLLALALWVFAMMFLVTFCAWFDLRAIAFVVLACWILSSI